MIGAILGDIIGSPYEFDRGDKTKDFTFFEKGAAFTDDSVMSVAVAEAIMKAGKDADEETMKSAFTDSMREWGRRYPFAGYGGMFSRWLVLPNPKPYNSFGNGSAMRVSSVGWFYDSLVRTEEVAEWSAAVTHNHVEGIKGAKATAGIIYLARNGAGKEEIKKYVVEKYHYNLDRTLDEIRPTYHMDETCQKTVPEAIIALMEEEDYEDVIRGAISLGGDTDTLGAIAGGMAEAMFGIPNHLIEEFENRVPEDMLKVVNDFSELTGR